MPLYTRLDAIGNLLGAFVLAAAAVSRVRPSSRRRSGCHARPEFAVAADRGLRRRPTSLRCSIWSSSRRTTPFTSTGCNGESMPPTRPQQPSERRTPTTSCSDCCSSWGITTAGSYHRQVRTTSRCPRCRSPARAARSALTRSDGSRCRASAATRHSLPSMSAPPRTWWRRKCAGGSSTCAATRVEIFFRCWRRSPRYSGRARCSGIDTRDGTTESFVLDDSGAVIAPDGSVLAGPPGRNPVRFTVGLPIAVVHGPGTASSGEGVVMALRGRPGVRSFGRPTAGVPTGNQLFELSDGSAINLTVAVGIDYGGEVHESSIAPDVVSHTSGGTDEARFWLTHETSCRGVHTRE